MILLQNRLYGPDDTQPTAGTLADSGDPVLLAAPSRARYDQTRQVFPGLASIRIESGFHRFGGTHGTPALTWDLPPAPWSARWYTWLPATQSAGFGNNEGYQIARFQDGSALTYYETTSGNAYARRAEADLAVPLVAPTNSGSARPIPGPLRWEALCDGTGLEVRVYTGQDTTQFRGMTWDGWTPTGTITWTGYRYRIRPTLYPIGLGYPENPAGQTAALQNELIDLGYDLGVWGADDEFGAATTAAVLSFQDTYGLTPVDGIPGPETRAAMDLALGRAPEPIWLSHLAVSDGPWIGPAAPPPAPPAELSRLTIGLPI